MSEVSRADVVAWLGREAIGWEGARHADYAEAALSLLQPASASPCLNDAMEYVEKSFQPAALMPDEIAESCKAMRELGEKITDAASTNPDFFDGMMGKMTAFDCHMAAEFMESLSTSLAESQRENRALREQLKGADDEQAE